MRTKQEVFDIAVAALLKQGKASSTNFAGSCKYRLDSTAECPIRCALGHLIPDELYTPKLEGRVPEIIQAYFPEVYAAIGLDDVYFLYELQACHDSCNIYDSDDFIVELKARVTKLATRYNLSTTILEQKVS